MLNIAICDDNKQLTGELDMIIYEQCKQKYIDSDISVFFDGKQLVDDIYSNAKYDIIFLDIEMKEQDGISTAKSIRQIDNNVLIIYVTSHEQYMKDVFEVRPFRFLVKPVNLLQIGTVLEEAYLEIMKNEYYYHFCYQRTKYKIPLKDILYFESNKRKINIKTRTETFEFYGKLNDVEEELKCGKGRFLRVHQSYLVNYSYIMGISYECVLMSNHDTIPISEERRRKISEQYFEIEGE